MRSQYSDHLKGALIFARKGYSGKMEAFLLYYSEARKMPISNAIWKKCYEILIEEGLPAEIASRAQGIVHKIKNISDYGSFGPRFLKQDSSELEDLTRELARLSGYKEEGTHPFEVHY